MSTTPYSLDLREKVIKFLQKGNSQATAAKVFNISKTTVNTWNVRYKQEGHLNPRQNLGAKAKVIKEDFITWVNANSNATSEDIGKFFGVTGSGARYWLRKIGYSYKKKPSPMWKRMKKREINMLKQ